MTAVAGIRPTSSTVSQWSVLTARLIVPMLRNGEIFVAIAASAAVTVSFYATLHQLLAPDLHESSYGQYLMPLIALQAMSFASVSTAFRASTDSVGGLNRRFRAMPIALLNPLVARLSAGLCRNAVGLVVALVCGYAVGFRFYRGPLETAGFCLLVLSAGAALTFLADAVGTSSLNPVAAAQWLLLPQLILGLASVGLQPVQRFPEWIRPIVRDQPVSQLVYALQALAGDRLPDVSAPTWSVTGPAVVWVAGGIVALLPLAVHLYRRMV